MVVHTCPQKTESKILDVPAPKIFSPSKEEDKFADMSNRDIELEIFRCSGILNESIKLANAKLRNGIVGKVGEYRQALRMELHRREQEGVCMHKNRELISLGMEPKYRCLSCGEIV
jgi:hypothetical protein